MFIVQCSFANCHFTESRVSGDRTERVTPVPIPNTEVKPLRADGTARATLWETRSLPGLKNPEEPQGSSGFLLYQLPAPGFRACIRSVLLTGCALSRLHSLRITYWLRAIALAFAPHYLLAPRYRACIRSAFLPFCALSRFVSFPFYSLILAIASSVVPYVFHVAS